MNFAKQQLETKANETKMVGIIWDKQSHSFIIEIADFCKRLTIRNILQTLPSIYDPLGFISPCLLTEKVIYRNVCDLKIPWDKKIPREIQNQWFNGQGVYMIR